MKLTCVGHQMLYDLQSIVSVFFPGESTQEGMPEVVSEMIRQPQWGCRTFLRADGTEFEAFVACEGEDDHAVRDAVKRSFFAVAVKFTGFTPDWGTFTGIRPAREYARMSRNPDEFAKIFDMSQDKARLCADIIDERKKLSIPTDKQDISLYVSIPFCPSRCAYCSFISGAGEKMLKLIPDYMEVLMREIRAVADLTSRRGLRLRTVYVGGGTPATLSSDQLADLIACIRECFGTDIMEFTVELGRPDAITDEKLDAVRSGGVDRICINPQTLNDDILQAIGRKHTTQQFLSVMEQAKKYGFKAINCDLIAGLPGDTPSGFKQSLCQIIDLGAQNITVHSLCLKQGSEFKAQGNALVRSRIAAEMIDRSVEHLKGCGYKPYYIYKQKHAVAALENTGWALDGTASLYNILMMDDLGTVIGVGAGSSSKVLGGALPYRVYSPKYPYEYMRDAGDFSHKMGLIEQALNKAD